MDEYFDVLDEQGEKTGVVKLRDDVHREGLWHRTVHLWVISPHNDIFLQKRADGFWLGKGYLDASCVGHVQAGQDSTEAVIRECWEELGLQITPEHLEFLIEDRVGGVGNTKKISPYINNEFHDVLVLTSEINIFDFKFDTQEMSGLELVTREEFGKMVKNRDSRLVPQWKEYEALLWYLGGK